MHQPSGLVRSCTVSIQCTTRTRSVRWLHVQLQTCCQQHHQFTTYCGVTLKSEQTTCQIKCGDRWIYLHLHKYVCMGYIVCMQYACRNLIQSFCFHSQVACLWTDLSLDLGLIEHKHRALRPFHSKRTFCFGFCLLLQNLLTAATLVVGIGIPSNLRSLYDRRFQDAPRSKIIGWDLTFNSIWFDHY